MDRTAPLAAGTPHPKGSKTHEQVKAFQDMRDPAFPLAVARAEFVNHVIAPDGSTSTDTGAMIEAAKAAVSAAVGGDPLDPATHERARDAARKVQEVTAHVAAHRFVFFVDEYGVPTTYLQAATPENIDVFPPEPDPNAPAAQQGSPASDAPAAVPTEAR